jgi:DNA-binding IclR family transcriptional regulator
MMAAMPDEAVDEVLDHGLTRYTSRTVLDRHEVWREIRSARDLGYGTNAAEWRSDIAAVGAAVVAAGGQPLAAFAVSMPYSRFQEMDRAWIAGLTIDAARRVSEGLGDRG